MIHHISTVVMKMMRHQAVTSGGVGVGASEMLVEEVAVAEMETEGVLFFYISPLLRFSLQDTRGFKILVFNLVPILKRQNSLHKTKQDQKPG